VVTEQVTYASVATNTVYQIPANTLVWRVDLVITTAFAGTTPLVDVGDEDNDDCFVDNTDVTETTAGLYRGDGGDATLYDGKFYSATKRLTIKVAGTSLTAGACHAVVYEIPLDGLV
jgi:hypothetical protein